MFLKTWIKRDFPCMSKHDVRNVKQFIEKNRNRVTGPTKMLETLTNEVGEI